jgi:hypothetical protein
MGSESFQPLTRSAKATVQRATFPARTNQLGLWEKLAARSRVLPLASFESKKERGHSSARKRPQQPAVTAMSVTGGLSTSVISRRLLSVLEQREQSCKDGRVDDGGCFDDDDAVYPRFMGLAVGVVFLERENSKI